MKSHFNLNEMRIFASIFRKQLIESELKKTTTFIYNKYSYIVDIRIYIQRMQTVCLSPVFVLVQTNFCKYATFCTYYGNPYYILQMLQYALPFYVLSMRTNTIHTHVNYIDRHAYVCDLAVALFPPKKKNNISTNNN